MRFGKTIVVTALLGIMTQGCSNSQQQAEGLEVSPDGQEVEVLPTDDAADTQVADGQEEVILDESAPLEEATEDGMEAIAADQTVSGDGEIGVADDSLDAIAASLGGDSEVATTPASGNFAMPSHKAAKASPSMASAAYLSRSESADGYSVMYAHSAGSLYDSPSQSGNQVASFDSGDHFLVKSEGEWAKISDSAYVPANSLGGQAIPRSRSGNPWK